MHPLEHRRLARERTVEVAAHDAERGRAVGLERGADLLGAGRQELRPRHLEEPERMVVAVDEGPRSMSSTTIASGAFSTRRR